MTKKIVICCDGTWNTPDEQSDGQPCPTNVVRVAEALSPTDAKGVEQLMFYDPGVGSSGNIFQRIFDGATGTGISHNIKDAYRFLIRHYETGDELYFFGFSRGAYTARSLAGLIRNSGLLKPDAVDKIHKAYKLYRSRRKGAHPKAKEAVLFRKTYSVADIIPIKFIGVWDTVGALGNPLWITSPLSLLNTFHDVSLSGTIANAYQCMAVDEKRRNFKECLWTMPHNAPEDQVLEQVWFPGVHSDIGGGYPTTDLSDIALQWMVEKAKSCGLQFNDFEPVPSPDPMGKMHESWRSFYKLISPYYRPVMQGKRTNESIHPSVKERYDNNPSYRPPNLKGLIN